MLMGMSFLSLTIQNQHYKENHGDIPVPVIRVCGHINTILTLLCPSYIPHSSFLIPHFLQGTYFIFEALKFCYVVIKAVCCVRHGRWDFLYLKPSLPVQFSERMFCFFCFLFFVFKPLKKWSL